MTPTERLIAAWVAWDHNPASAGAVQERINAMAAAGLPVLATQLAVARNRARGLSIPDAIQTAINDMGAAAR